ncbi:hypothetical protein [Burkholderia sp. AU32262]|uniref:hypothetical protein n=1 Tax=Burkholderia sp. AU32262 TaxID=2879630 RepID=UPI001CF41596|nr:hypothetical protein [Burkholderia sp. AU32262]MCA8242884.1 hypothetical protein [Burkholderia sp. AU32262]
MNEAPKENERATIMDACQSISRSADALKSCHTVDGDWGEDLDAKAFYDAEMLLLGRLTAMLDNPAQPEPIDMLLFCPKCGVQHVDAPEPFTPAGRCECAGPDECETCESNRAAFEESWQNPPHRSHLCHACGTIWRPADVPTNGVAAIQTRGKADTWNGQREPRASAGVIAAARAVIEADRAQTLTTEHVNALDNAINIHHGELTLRKPRAAASPDDQRDGMRWRALMKNGEPEVLVERTQRRVIQRTQPVAFSSPNLTGPDRFDTPSEMWVKRYVMFAWWARENEHRKFIEAIDAISAGEIQ